jgi:hypothetical protein
MTSVADLATELGVDTADVAVLLGRLDAETVELPDEVVTVRRDRLNPNGERTQLSRYWPHAET